MMIFQTTQIEKMYNLFKSIHFDECKDCSDCCDFLWLLKEEQQKNLDLGQDIEELNSVVFVKNCSACTDNGKHGCAVYEQRPLDCRIFPLDLIEEDGEYWWSIFTSCPKYKSILEKQIPIIPELEKLFTKQIFRQYQNQIAVVKKIYEPYRLKQYEKIKRFEPARFTI